MDLFERRVESVASPRCQAWRSGSLRRRRAPRRKKEDWWLVRAHSADQTSMAGWILGRFIDLDVPAPLPDYASSAAHAHCRLV